MKYGCSYFDKVKGSAKSFQLFHNGFQFHLRICMASGQMAQGLIVLILVWSLVTSRAVNRYIILGMLSMNYSFIF